MRRIIKRIEHALYRHECVIVPGMGAFIRHENPSILDESKGLIYPGKSVLSFNGALTREDGVLSDDYRQAFSLNYRRAAAMVEDDARELLSELRSSSVLQLGNLGKMSMDKTSGQLTFFPNPDHPFSISYYGLTSVSQLPGLTPMTNEDSGPIAKKGVYYLPIHIEILKYGAAAMILGALALLIPRDSLTPYDGQDYRAGFLTVLEEKAKPDVVDPGVETSIGDLQEEKILDGAHAAIVQQSESDPHGVVQRTDAPRYYVVIASLGTEGLADKYLKENPEHAAFPNGGVIHRGSQYRVYAADFGTAEEADNYRRTLVQEHPELSSAWVFKTR